MMCRVILFFYLIHFQFHYYFPNHQQFNHSILIDFRLFQLLGNLSLIIVKHLQLLFVIVNSNQKFIISYKIIRLDDLDIMDYYLIYFNYLLFHNKLLTFHLYISNLPLKICFQNSISLFKPLNFLFHLQIIISILLKNHL